jgi:hypothetical protein
MQESKENIENSENVVIVKRTRGRPRKVVSAPIPDDDIVVDAHTESSFNPDYMKKIKQHTLRGAKPKKKVVASSEPKPKKKVKSLWVDALKIYNKDKKFIVPKKGSDEYNEVKKIMQSFAQASSASTI